jgi:glycosyltransferase WbpL
VILQVLIAGCAALLASALLTGLVMRLALRYGIVDSPNARSSHVRVTPRGGGVAIAIVCVVGVAAMCATGWADARFAAALGVGGTFVALIGFLDDRHSVSVATRLLVHCVSAALAVYLLGGLPPLQVGARVVDLGLFGDLLATAATVWAVNAFNFMDGIDGIAASEASLVAVLGGALAFGALNGSEIAGAAAIFAGSCCGFLLWNWPPARIFMGDAGSGFLGFFVAVLALGAAQHAPAAPFVWLILAGAFFVDATTTFARRLLRGARVHQAHREHAYQWLARRWGSHRTVDWVLIGINVGWLAPCAWYAGRHPDLAYVVSIVALAPLVPVALIAGAGREEMNEARKSTLRIE